MSSVRQLLLVLRAGSARHLTPRRGKTLESQVSVLKVDLHIHTGDDPVDDIPYTTKQLIDRAAELGFDALAITLHDHQLEIAPLVSYAAERGIVLIRGIERTIEGRHVLLLNFEQGANRVQSFADLRSLKVRERGLVIAPHPFFPTSTCLREQMEPNADLFDAVEYNAMFTRGVNFNREGVRWAERHRKPMVGNGDVHRLTQLGTTFTLVDAEPTADAICDAVIAGRVTIEARPHSVWTATQLVGDLIVADLFRPARASTIPSLARI